MTYVGQANHETQNTRSAIGRDTDGSLPYSPSQQFFVDSEALTEDTMSEDVNNIQDDWDKASNELYRVLYLSTTGAAASLIKTSHDGGLVATASPYGEL